MLCYAIFNGWAGTWSVLVWLVSLVSCRSVGWIGGRKVLGVSTALAGGALVGITLTVWKVCCSGSFSRVLATSIASNHKNHSDNFCSSTFNSQYQKIWIGWISLIFGFLSPQLAVESSCSQPVKWILGPDL